MSLLAKPERNERGLVGQGERMEGLPMLVGGPGFEGHSDGRAQGPERGAPGGWGSAA